MTTPTNNPRWSAVLSPQFVRLGVGYSCPMGCDWQHIEHPDNDPIPPIRLPDYPSRCTPEQLSAAFTAAADERHRAYMARVERACTDHLNTEHPNVDQTRLLDTLARAGGFQCHEDQRRHEANRQALINAITKGIA